MTNEQKVVNAIIANSPKARPTSTYKIQEILADSGLTVDQFLEVIMDLADQQLIQNIFGNNSLTAISLTTRFPTKPSSH